MIQKNPVFSIFTLAIIVFAIWSTYVLYFPKARIKLSANNLPDAFMEDVRALVLDKDGNPHVKIKSPKMIHYAENNSTDLITPQITLYRDSPEPWDITAKMARAQQGVDIIDFWENVRIHHPPDGKSADTVITTSALTVDTNEQLADTDALIQLEQPNIIIKSVGMHAEMKTGNIKLLSKVWGEYVPG